MAQPLYRLGDSFAARRPAASLELLLGLLEEGEPGQRVLATLHRSLRQLRGAKALQERRASRDEMIRRLQLLPFKVGDVLAAASRWSEADLARALAALGTADRRMKTGVAAEVALSAAVVEACGRGPGEARPGPRPGR
jgi:DNA polymerase III delta subunit